MAAMAQEQLSLWDPEQMPPVEFCVKDLDDQEKCRSICPNLKPHQLQFVKALVTNGWSPKKALLEANYPASYSNKSFKTSEYFPRENFILRQLALYDPENGWWISEMLDSPPESTLDSLRHAYYRLLYPDDTPIELRKKSGATNPNIEWASKSFKILLAKKRAEMENLQSTFEWKVKKLVELVELCTPSDAETHKETNPGSTISAISELNKMQGHYAPDRTVNANMNIESDPSIECVRETMEEIFLSWERDF
jgi:hypothetical protein